MKRYLAKRLWLSAPAIVIFLTLAVWLTARSSEKGVSVTFQRFIDHSVNGRMALFVITNQQNHSVLFSAGPCCQLKSNGVWETHMHGGRFIGQTADDTWTWFGTLEPGAWTNIAILTDEGPGNWRAAVQSGRPPGKMRRLVFHLRNNWRAVRERRSLPGFKGSAPWNTTTSYSREFPDEFGTREPSSSAEIPEPSR